MSVDSRPRPALLFKLDSIIGSVTIRLKSSPEFAIIFQVFKPQTRFQTLERINRRE
jgi:hypothetical protein